MKILCKHCQAEAPALWDWRLAYYCDDCTQLALDLISAPGETPEWVYQASADDFNNGLILIGDSVH